MNITAILVSLWVVVGSWTFICFHTGYYIGRLRQWTRTERFLNEPKYFQVLKYLNDQRRRGKI